MRFLPPVLFILLLSCVSSPAQAQEPTETFLLLRTATDRGAYHYAEVFQQRGKIIVPDIGYIDFDEAKAYREFWIGGGGVALNTKALTFIAEAFLDKALGSSAGGALYFQPWFLTLIRMTPHLVGEVVYFPYVPLNHAGRAQHVLERAKLEYDFRHFKVGGGYGAYKFGEFAWHHKPFITGTLKAGEFGNLELWLQRMPGDDLTVQFRYLKIFRR